MIKNKSDILEKRINDAISLIKPNSIYFGHPVNVYNTLKEAELIKNIEFSLRRFNVYNPNQKHNQENYKIWKQKFGNGMKYYFDVVLPKMSAGIFLSFEDGMWGAGIFGEAEFLYNQGKPIWEISNDGVVLEVSKLDNSKCLTIEETRKRVYR